MMEPCGASTDRLDEYSTLFFLYTSIFASYAAYCIDKQRQIRVMNAPKKWPSQIERLLTCFDSTILLIRVQSCSLMFHVYMLRSEARSNSEARLN